jgi:hypothetical protein
MPTITNFGDVVTQGNTTCQQRLSVQGTSTFVGAAGFSSLTTVTGSFTASANAAILNVSSGSYLTTLNVSSTSNMASLNIASANAQSLFASSAQISNSNIQSLNVSSENVTTINISGTAWSAAFVGPGSGLSSLNASNINAGALLGTYLWGNTVSNVNASNVAIGALASQYLQTSQGNITSVGTLTSLAVTGSTTTGWFIGSGNTLSNVNASNVIIGALAATNLQNNQTNITSVGTLTSLAVTGSTTTGWFVGSGNTLSNVNASNVAIGALAATNLQNNQTNITSVGTLTSLGVTNGVTAGWFVGSGNTLSNVNASNVAIGALASQYLQASQGNITSVGTLTSLAVTGSTTTGWFVGSGNTLSNVNASNVAIGALASQYLQAGQGNITSVGTLTSLAVTGAATAGWFIGSGNTVSNVNASNIAIGALSSTQLQAAQTNITSVGTLTSLAVTNGLTAGWHVGGANTLSNVNASNISYGILNSSLITGNTISNVNASNVAFGTLNGSWILGNTLSNINASNIASGTLTLTTPITGSLFVGAGNALSNVSGVGAGTYGSAGGGQYPLITVDASGRITSITNQGVQGTQWSGSTGNPIYYNQNYVGIGTSNPLTALDVRGNAYVLGNLATWYTQTATLGAELIYSVRNASTTVSGTGVTIAIFDTSLLPPGVTGTVYLKYNAPGTGSVYFVKNGSKLYNLATSEAVFIGGVSAADGSAQLTLKFSGTGSITFTDFYFVADTLSVTSNTSIQGNINATVSITAPMFIGGGNVLSNIQASNVNGTIVVTQIAGGGNTISNLNASNITYGNLLGSWILGNTLSNINVSNISGYVTANVLSNINASNIAFGAIATTFLQNNQTNITSVGTLTSLAVTGGASAGWVVGGANSLSNINASNIAFGSIPTTYLQNNQTNITSVGTLTSLAVTGAATAGWFAGGANTLSNINASNISSATTLTLTTPVTASIFIGGGNVLSNIQASNVNGTIVVTQIAGGGNTISNLNASNIIYGNLLGSWILGNTLSNINVSNISGYVTANVLSNINASNIAFGSIPTTYLQNNQTNITSVGTLTSLGVTNGVTAGWHIGGANTLSNVNASNIAIGALATTYLQNNQTNITSVGTLTSLAVTGAATAGWFIGGANTLSNVNASNVIIGALATTYIQNNQTNITSVGTLTSLGVTNGVTAGWHIGGANTLSNVNASNIAIGALATTYLQNNQTNITSVGTLTSLAVTGATTTGWFVGSANTLSNVNASNVAIGALATTYLQNNQTNITSVGTLTSLVVTGAATAGWHVGGGNTLSNVNASNVAIGALATTYLQNNQTNITSVGTLTSLAVTNGTTAGWFIGGANTLSNVNASNIAIGALSATQLQAAQTNITSVGTLTSLAVTNGVTAGWHIGGANTLSNVNASNVAIGALATTYLQNNQTNITSVGTLTTLSVTGNVTAGWFAGSGNTLSNINASNIAIGALSSSQLQSTQANISAIGTVGTGLAVSGPLGITNLVITGGSTPTIGQYLQATSTGGALTWATVTTGGVTGNTISNINASNVVLGYFGNILTLANTASWFDLPAYMNVYQVYQTRAGSISGSGSGYAVALQFNNSLYVPTGVVGKMVVVYSTGSGTIYNLKTNATYALSAGGGRIEIPNLSAADSNPANWQLQYFGGTTSSITYTDLWFEAYSTQITSSNVVFGNAAASYTNVVMYSNLTVNGSIQSLVDVTASNAATVGTGIRLYGANSTIISATAVSTANLSATNGAIICAFPTRKFYSWSGAVTSSSAPTFTLTFANYAFYTKIVAILMDTSGTVNSVSTLSIEAAGGSADGTTPSNSIVIGSKNLFGPTLTNPWSATVTTSATTIVLVPTNSSFYSWQISAEVIGSSAALNTLAQSANPTTSKTFNY